MKLIRWVLGRVILLLNWAFSSPGVERDSATQARLDQMSANWSLYHFNACPFCVKVRRSIKRQSLTIETRDVKRDPAHREELLKQGGRVMVPCLRIQQDNGKVRWLYESADIINYLEQQVARAS